MAKKTDTSVRPKAKVRRRWFVVSRWPEAEMKPSFFTPRPKLGEVSLEPEADRLGTRRGWIMFGSLSCAERFRTAEQARAHALKYARGDECVWEVRRTESAGKVRLVLCPVKTKIS